MFYYKSHWGGIITSKTKLTEKELYCERCDRYDVYLGEFKTQKDFIKYITKKDNSISLSYLSYKFDYSITEIREMIK